MTERSLDNIRIATKALVGSVISQGTFFLVLMGLPFLMPKEQDSGIYREESTFLELGLLVTLFILLALSVVLPVVTVRRELQKRKVSSYLSD